MWLSLYPTHYWSAWTSLICRLVTTKWVHYEIWKYFMVYLMILILCHRYLCYFLSLVKYEFIYVGHICVCLCCWLVIVMKKRKWSVPLLLCWYFSFLITYRLLPRRKGEEILVCSYEDFYQTLSFGRTIYVRTPCCSHQYLVFLALMYSNFKLWESEKGSNY
jgi:hypothetical protein